MKIEAIHHVSLLISDLERSLDFFCGLLGLELDSARPDLGYPGAWLNLGDQQIHLMCLPNPDAGRHPPEHGGRDRHLALRIVDIEDLQSLLTQASIPYTLSRSGRRALFCRDPDGNALEFIASEG